MPSHLLLIPSLESGTAQIHNYCLSDNVMCWTSDPYLDPSRRLKINNAEKQGVTKAGYKFRLDNVRSNITQISCLGYIHFKAHEQD